ncbi:MAG: hypothetical protein US42_C0019G0005 [Candidatus Magasanikbacteria bacterium GW2011_GWC2_37_14]|uniref:Uncharacterized protein n=1 Tax=Candidatus Magasanikbacteria bacterium GW2011_GWC2_37_14 TaxID=1619046 RepID=A0A0G0GL73_9BACT|nr:MAG: hypothetical protein US42_C0019G0005 [Candidatus Magasanikbacteria bacterium GW2011_GWC2_37_14]
MTTSVYPNRRFPPALSVLSKDTLARFVHLQTPEYWSVPLAPQSKVHPVFALRAAPGKLVLLLQCLDSILVYQA